MKGVLIVITAAPTEPLNSREIYAIQTELGTFKKSSISSLKSRQRFRDVLFLFLLVSRVGCAL